MKTTKLFLGILLLTATFSCKTKTSTEKVNMDVTINYTWNGAPFTMNNFDTVENAAGNKMILNVFKYFLSNIYMTKDGKEVKVGDYYFIDYTQNSASTFKINDVEEGTYESIRFNLGLDNPANHSDPSSYPNSSALSLINGAATMHWNWADGYIFCTVQGNSLDNGNNKGFAYHIGRDTRLCTFNFSKSIEATKSTNAVSFELDLAKIFNSPNVMNVSKTDLTHSPAISAFADSLYQNLNNCISIK